MLFNSYIHEILYEQFHWIYLQGDIKLLLVAVNNRLKFEIEIVHDLSCHPIYHRLKYAVVIVPMQPSSCDAYKQPVLPSGINAVSHCWGMWYILHENIIAVTLHRAFCVDFAPNAVLGRSKYIWIGDIFP